MIFENKEKVIQIRALANKWLMDNFSEHRGYLSHQPPKYKNDEWVVTLVTKNINGHETYLGKLAISNNGNIIKADNPKMISKSINELLQDLDVARKYGKYIYGSSYQFSNGDGVNAAKRFDDGKIELLLTDPPYGISESYGCEKQIPRRLRSDGRDFIMPRGYFGDWDTNIQPHSWLNIVLPKVGGWFVSFCGHAQIDAYQRSLKEHKFVAVGTLVWQKTNPVPFNSRHKPVNAWEAVVVGKRSGVAFNGQGVVHNVFKHKSPSPQSRIHPTQKPLGLLKRFVELFSTEGGIIYDPFAGSGSTLIAGVQMKRYAIGYEIDQDIYQSGCARIKGEINGAT